MGSVVIALAGDTMLGRGVGELLAERPDRAIASPAVTEATRSADLFVCNLECCVSDRGSPWPDPRKPFFFRAPPSAAQALAGLGVDAVTLGNNHALDYGSEALLDTLAWLDEEGIAHAGAGADAQAARRPAVLERAGGRIVLVSVADHPREYAARPGRAGVAFADLREGTPPWLTRAVADAGDGLVLVSPHWGPNMTESPVPHVRAAARSLARAGATLIAGHSAHVFHGAELLGGCPCLYDLGGFIDDYAVDPVRRNDLGLLWFVECDGAQPVAVEALPLKLDYGFTDIAKDADRTWIARRLRQAVRPLRVEEAGDRLRVDLATAQPLSRAQSLDEL